MGAGDSIMTTKTCVFDAAGNLINIGEWDEVTHLVEIGTETVEVSVPDDYDLQLGEEWLDETEGAKKISRTIPVFENQPRNPLPTGAYIEEREVVYDEKYGWRLADEPIPVSDKERIEALEAALLEVILQNG